MFTRTSTRYHIQLLQRQERRFICSCTPSALPFTVFPTCKHTPKGKPQWPTGMSSGDCFLSQPRWQQLLSLMFFNTVSTFFHSTFPSILRLPVWTWPWVAGGKVKFSLNSFALQQWKIILSPMILQTHKESRIIWHQDPFFPNPPPPLCRVDRWKANLASRVFCVHPNYSISINNLAVNAF